MPSFEASALRWIGLAIVAAIVEVSTPHFGVIFVTVAAVAAALAAFVGVGLAYEASGVMASLGGIRELLQTAPANK